MIKIKTPEEIVLLREGGRRLAFILEEVSKKVLPGITLDELNSFAEKLIFEKGDKAAFLGYKPRGAKEPYPSSLCVSVNEEIVHGIAKGNNRALQDGDIVSLDLGLVHKSLITDHAVTIAVGTISKEAQELIRVTKEALVLGIQAAKPDGHVGDIGAAIEKYVKTLKPRVSIVEGLAGHGVGHSVHEEPFVPNSARAGTGPVLKPGVVIAIEPMLAQGGPEIVLEKDGYTYRSKDRSLAAHFEHTVVITETGAEILTKE